MKCITFTGWGQPADALACIAPGAEHFPYVAYKDKAGFLSSLGPLKTSYDVVIGWSLGGQLALQAVDQGILSPKLMVLIATPFQFIESETLGCGVYRNVFEKFKHDYVKSPVAMLKRFNTLIAHNDTQEKAVLQKMGQDTAHTDEWLGWLEVLGEYSCQDMLFNNVPSTLIIHGRNDTVVDVGQASVFLPFIKKSRIHIMEGCGHAPHLHDAGKVKALIQEAYAS